VKVVKGLQQQFCGDQGGEEQQQQETITNAHQ